MKQRDWIDRDGRQRKGSQRNGDVESGGAMYQCREAKGRARSYFQGSSLEQLLLAM